MAPSLSEPAHCGRRHDSTSKNTKKNDPKDNGDEDDTWIDRRLDWLRHNRLHPVLEVIAAWVVAFLCLLYYGHVYTQSLVSVWSNKKQQTTLEQVVLVPLTNEVKNRRGLYQDDIHVANKIDELYQSILKSLLDRVDSNRDKDNGKADNSMSPSQALLLQKRPEELVARIRHDLELRRKVSQFVSLVATTHSTTTTQCNENPSAAYYYTPLLQMFESIWLDLLRMPPIMEDNDSSRVSDTTSTPDIHCNPIPCSKPDETGPNRKTSCRFEISLILPAFREDGATVARTLMYAKKHCDRLDAVQVIVVDAGHCIDLEAHVLVASQSSAEHSDPILAAPNRNNQHRQQQTAPEQRTQDTTCWGDLKVVQYTGNGGRGPCQNFGASHATGRFLTFLHSDTVLPRHWDTKVKQALMPPPPFSAATKVTHACTFSVGHNVSREGLDSRPYPWGIRSILFLGNLRAYLFRLPYGDHILSFPATTFRFLGGFTDQPIMEDYDMMDLLRQRAQILPEQLRIIPPPTGLCSVRRWQSLGVTYVTLVNALVIHRYAHGGWTAKQVYDYYYRRPFSDKKDQ